METGATAKCAECGFNFLVDNMIRHANAYVCANCKPRFMQKLAEGADINIGKMRYAGFWTRFAAVFLDAVILWVISFCVSLIAGLSVGQAIGLEPNEALILQLLLIVFQFALAIAYEVILIGKYGATLGKMACKIKVVTAEGDPVSYLRVLGRYFAKLLSSVILLIGYIMAAFDPEGRALHDRICNTRVVLKEL